MRCSKQCHTPQEGELRVVKSHPDRHLVPALAEDGENVRHGYPAVGDDVVHDAAEVNLLQSLTAA